MALFKKKKIIGIIIFIILLLVFLNYSFLFIPYPYWTYVPFPYKIDHFKTCLRCSSTVWIREERNSWFKKTITILPHVTTSSYSTCNHVWIDGFMDNLGPKVKDNQVILVRKNGKYGAVILHQDVNPEKIIYEWYARSDGLGRLDAAGTLTGINTTDILIEHKSYFITTYENKGPFLIYFEDYNIAWSGITTGEGRLYYDYKPAGLSFAPTENLRICVTTFKPVYDYSTTWVNY